MRVVCAWCDTLLYETDEEPRDAISHGICHECFEAVVGGLTEREEENFVDKEDDC